MSYKKIYQLIPFPKLIRLLIILCIIIQLVIISYNHLTGFYHVTGIIDFLIRLIYSTILSVFASLLIAYPDLFSIDLLNKKFSWDQHIISRIVVQLLFTILIAIVIAIFITILADYIDPYDEELTHVMINNSLIMIVINLILMIILEGWIYFNESYKAKIKAENLERELTAIRFDVLKSQINPHFMFNSLNVLSGLISKDTKKAQEFIAEFSMVYRYVLETIEKSLVNLEDEIDFLRSYIYLQQIRYNQNLKINIDLPSDIFHQYLPPLSLQLLIENAIKHNMISHSQPLQIKIYYEDRWLIIKNNIQSKVSKGTSTRLGHKNLIKRYALISKKLPQFKIVNNSYIAKIPLIEDE